jgi:hypothetical protein
MLLGMTEMSRRHIWTISALPQPALGNSAARSLLRVKSDVLTLCGLLPRYPINGHQHSDPLVRFVPSTPEVRRVLAKANARPLNSCSEPLSTRKDTLTGATAFVESNPLNPGNSHYRHSSPWPSSKTPKFLVFFVIHFQMFLATLGRVLGDPP